jgi:predicted RNA-binding Zn-ribbon protein involved in translation (DUF1610 family)
MRRRSNDIKRVAQNYAQVDRKNIRPRAWIDGAVCMACGDTVGVLFDGDGTTRLFDNCLSHPEKELIEHEHTVQIVKKGCPECGSTVIHACPGPKSDSLKKKGKK